MLIVSGQLPLPGSVIPDPGFEVPLPGFVVPDPGFEVPLLGFVVPDPGFVPLLQTLGLRVCSSRSWI